VTRTIVGKIWSIGRTCGLGRKWIGVVPVNPWVAQTLRLTGRSTIARRITTNGREHGLMTRRFIVASRQVGHATPMTAARVGKTGRAGGRHTRRSGVARIMREVA